MKKISICLTMALLLLMCSESKNTLRFSEKTYPASYEDADSADRKSTAASKNVKNQKKTEKNTKNPKSAQKNPKDSEKTGENIKESKDKGFASVSRESNSVLLGGDILLEEDLLDFIDEFGKDYPIKKLQSALSGYDIVFANLETPIGTKGTPASDKPYIFMISPYYAEPIRKMHLNIVSIANNHIMDYGKEGLDSTISWLKANRILYAGAGNNLDEARKPAIINKKGIDFVFLAYNERPPESFYARKNRPGTAYVDIQLITEDVKKYKTKSNIVMVSLHWGIEQTLHPQQYQIDLARRIIDAGADCIIGHHPHWIQGIEIYKKKPIFYSLGNLINGFYNKVEHNNFLAVLRYKGLKLRRIEILPLAGKNTEIDFQPYLLTGKQAEEHLKFIQRLCSRFPATHFVIKGDKGFVYILDEMNNYETRGRGKKP